MHVCGIYDKRPKRCRDYPRADSYQPESCGYFFPGDGTRRGRCEEECDATCCKLPREKGEPGGAAMPEVAGGLPCKHLEYTEVEIAVAPEKKEKTEGDIRSAPTTVEE